MIPKSVHQCIEQRLDTKIVDFTPASGGCISNGGRLKTSVGNFFIKWNGADQFPQMFEKEKHGLELLRSTTTINTPQVNITGCADKWQFIIMEFVEDNGRSKNYWHDLGNQLAALHKHSNSSFGLDHDNFIGSLVQRNTMSHSWISFFVEQRLAPLLQMLRDANEVDEKIVKSFESLYPRLREIIPDEEPSLLHGDLWNGNVIVGANGAPYCIDPAVYFGHREMEIAFTKLFGGFENAFFDSYHESFPLQPGFDQRYDIYNLYPLLVHANLFGQAYLSSAKAILAKYT